MVFVRGADGTAKSCGDRAREAPRRNAMPDGFILEIPGQVGLPTPTRRSPEAATRAWPEGTVIVSADSHMLEADCWIDRFPPHLKDKAPRMLFKDGGWDLSIEGKSTTPALVAAGLCEAMECYPGLTDLDHRLRDLDVEGVEKELIFPQRLFGLLMFHEIAHRKEVFEAYNAHIGEVCAKSGGRLFPVMVPSYWDPAQAEASVALCKAQGARCLLIPIKPGKDDAGRTIHYNHPGMDPLWAAIEASGLPMAFHIGEAIPSAEAGAVGISVLTQMQGFRHSWGQLVFGGVLDRFPGLKVVFVEGGLAWVASMLHDADMIYNSFPTGMNPQLKHPPSWYWRNNCYATFMTDPVGLSLLDRIGADRVMWSSDYPHQESTFGYTRGAIEAVFRATSVENAQQILGKTALDLFDMH
jgi:predicted TIM-barrel fold metal-dependent hydrolase